MSTEHVNSSDSSLIEASAQADTAVQTSEPVVWYRRLSEDWLATIFGLLLVLLIVLRVLRAIP